MPFLDIYPSMEHKTIAWLKVFKKPHEKIEEIERHIDFWLDAFKNNKYRIIIYNENVELSEKYNKFDVLSRSDVLKNPVCRVISEKIYASSTLAERWKNAASALAFPYFYFSSEYIWNIDASDIVMDGPIESYLDKIFVALNQYNLPFLSSDIYLTTPNLSWSFGINLAQSHHMNNIIEAALDISVSPADWGTNLDHLIDQYIKYHNFPYRYCAFTTNDWIKHEGDSGLWSRFNKEKNMGECNLYGKTRQFGFLNSKSLLIE